MKKRVTGLTLIELMMTLAILVVLATLAGPSFTAMFANNRISSATNDLIADLARARNEAVRRGGIVTVCASSDATTCNTTAPDWGKGRLVIIGASVTSVSATDILRRSSVSSQLTITPASFTTTGYLSYNAEGAVTSTNDGTFTICQSGFIGRVVTVTKIGRSSLAKTTSACS